MSVSTGRTVRLMQFHSMWNTCISTLVKLLWCSITHYTNVLMISCQTAQHSCPPKHWRHSCPNGWCLQSALTAETMQSLVCDAIHWWGCVQAERHSSFNRCSTRMQMFLKPTEKNLWCLKSFKFLLFTEINKTFKLKAIQILVCLTNFLLMEVSISYR
jgi:hypothetical protein